MKPNLPALAMVILLPLLLSGQSRWMRSYHDDWDSYLSDIVIAYDKGCLISASTLSLEGYHNWMMKTDINGEELWEKLITFDYGPLAALDCMSQNDQGEIFLAGSFQDYGGEHDPIIIKLNACGEKEWCRRISTTISNDYADDICALKDGGCTVTLKNSGFVWNQDRVCLLSLDADGNFKWKECYNGLDSNIFFIEHEDLMLAPDDGYLITGSCNYSDTNPIVYFRTLPYLIKTDSLGQIQWELILEKDSSEIRGEGFSSIISPDGLSYYTSIKQGIYNENENAWWPALLKTDLEGNEMEVYDVAPPGEDNDAALYKSVFLNNSILASIASWGEEPIQKKLILMNPEGAILKEVAYFEGSYYDKLRLDSDGKLLIYLQAFGEQNDIDIYLLKFNNQLIDDTLYLQPMRYDTLCQYTILSDTIFLDDCDVIVDIDENSPGQKSQADYIRTWPNPCRDYITLSFINVDELNRIDFYSVYGQHLYSQDIEIKQNQVTINTGIFPPGIIIAVLRTSDNKIYTLKIIKL